MGARIKKHVIIQYRIIYPTTSQKYGAQCSAGDGRTTHPQ